MPIFLAFGDPDPADDPGTSRERSCKPGRRVGVEEEALHQFGPELSERASKLRDGPERIAAVHAQANDLDSRGAARTRELSLWPEADDRRLPAAAVEACCQGNKCSLGAADIEVGDDQCDGYRPVGPGTPRRGRESTGQGLHRGETPGSDGGMPGDGAPINVPF
jgi:hypothetical protein